MSIDACTIAKNALSEALLVPDGPPGVFGVGVGIARECDGEEVKRADYSVRIYSSTPLGQDVRQAIEAIAGLITPIREFPTEVQFNGDTIRIESRICQPPRLSSLADVHGPKCKTIQGTALRPGSSVSTGTGDEGTIACFLDIGSEIFLLSCSHVIAANGDRVDEAPMYSGSEVPIAKLLDLGTNAVRFGSVVLPNGKKVYETNEMDAAIAKVFLDVETSASMRSYWLKNGYKIRGVFDEIRGGRTDPEKSYRVSKHGQFSCETGGWIDDVDCDFIMGNGGAAGKFVRQFRVIRTDKPNKYVPGQASTFSVEGDSGSLVFDNHKTKGHRAIGMLIGAGNQVDFNRAIPFDRTAVRTGDDYSVITPISTIFSKLSAIMTNPVKLYTGRNSRFKVQDSR